MINTKLAHSRCSFPALLLTVLASRLLFAFVIWKVGGPSAFLAPDSYGYLVLARSLLHGSFSTAGLPEIWRTPGYPLFLVPAVAVGHPVLIGLLGNFFLVGLTTWLIWRLANSLLPGSNAGVWAVLLYGIEPVSVLHSGRLLSETLFCSQALLFVWLLLAFIKRPFYLLLVTCVLALAMATYTRPVSLYLGIGLVPLLLVRMGDAPLRRRMVAAAVFSLAFLLALSPWFIRNSKVAGYKGFASVPDWNLYFMSAAAVEANLQHRSFLQVSNEWGNDDPERYFQKHPEQRAWSQAEIAKFWGSEARRIISQHPLLYARIHLHGCMIVLFDPEVTEMLKPLRLYPEYGGLMSRSLDSGFLGSIRWLFRNYPVAATVLPLSLVLVVLNYILAIAGLCLVPRQIRLLFLALTSYFVLVSGIPAATGRYRAPIMPIVCICAGVAIAAWIAKRSVKTTPTGTSMTVL
jgi:4-amino-4-deoxy-L-arabinose transferase-like glycosyltransferase